MSIGLEKLTITPFARRNRQYERLEAIRVLFNPESYTVSKSVTWSPPQSSSGGSPTQAQVNAPTLSFGGGGSRQLSLELFFDVTGPVWQLGRWLPIFDVREETNKIVALTRIQRNEDQPRVCEVDWGQAPVGSDFPFIGVVSNLTQKFTHFKSDGRPVRANLSVTFLEFLDPELDKRLTDPERSVRTLKRGESLSQIAAEVYGDPRLWRVIAQANQIDDPRQLTAGITLTIPSLP